MALELKQDKANAIAALWKVWDDKSSAVSSETELEATFQGLNYTRFLDIIKTLRSMGLHEEIQPPRLNIIVRGGMRFTLTGDSNIEAYCNDNDIKGKPFNVMLKSRANLDDTPAEVDIPDYNMRIKLRREQQLNIRNTRVLELMKTWNTELKSFRYIHRYTFKSAKFPGLKFDASFVRQSAFVRPAGGREGGFDRKRTFQEADLGSQPLRFEMEVEAIPGKDLKLKEFLTGVSYVLRGIQNSYVITRDVVRKRILELLSKLTGTKRVDIFPGALPSTLERKNINVIHDTAIPNIRFVDYNCTDKADGVRCLLLVDPESGKLFMIDRNMNVIGTDRQLPSELVAEWGGALLDGEWVTQDLHNNKVSRYYAFDIFNFKRGEDVTARPFYIRPAGGPEEPVASRLAALTEACGVLRGANRLYKGIPIEHSFDVRQKIFYIPDAPPDVDPLGIFKKAGDALRDVKTRAEYHTDGLIFTPNADPMRKFGRWEEQLKWKPADMNSVDFLVTFEKQVDMEGNITLQDQIMPRIHPETNQETRCKTMYLHVGADPMTQPRETILYQMDLSRLVGGSKTYRPVRFTPEMADPMASVCYMAINPGATDTAAAAPAARVIPALTDYADMVFCESGDHIPDGSIVEMSYDPTKPAGWRWKPMRVRWDKTEQFSRGIIGRTLNSIETANNVWSSIHDPITEYMISSGSMSPSEEEIATMGVADGPVKTVYYTNRAPEIDLHQIAGLSKFHNNYIKGKLLLHNVIRPGDALLDMSVGQGGDLHKWIAAKAGFVLGCDVANYGIVDKQNGAYARYLKRILDAIPRRIAIPPMIFTCADSSKRYSDGSAGLEEIDRQILRTIYGEDIPTAPPLVKQFKNLGKPEFPGFDVCAVMFALHYFFLNETTLNGLLHNIHESLKVGGYFIGCCFDGDTVIRMMRERRIQTGETMTGNDGASQIWSITKQYEGDELPATAEGLGMKIDVEFISIGQKLSEYLVSWPFLQSKMEEIGLELLNADELREFGLRESSNMFNVSYQMAADNGERFEMTRAQKQFSFLNRWFIFRRRVLKSPLKDLEISAPLPLQPLPLPSAEMSGAAAPPAAAPAENAAATPSPALYEVGTTVLDKNGVVGMISKVSGPVEFISGSHSGELVYTYVVEFSDGAPEIVYEFNLEPILGTDRLRFVGKRMEVEKPPEFVPPPSAAVLNGNSNINSLPPLERVDGSGEDNDEAEAEPEPEPEPKPAGPRLEAATGPTYQFYHKSAAKDDFGLKLKHWRRYLSPYAPFTYYDLMDRSIEYPSLEAAWYGSLMSVASSNPGLRRAMFSVESTTHQNAVTARGETAFNPEQIDSYVEEGKKYHGLIDTPAKLRRAGIDNKEAWNERKEQILIDLIKQRYDRDPVFKQIIDAVRDKKARLYFYSISGKDIDLAGTLSGEEIRGDNLLGRAYMYLAGLTY